MEQVFMHVDLDAFFASVEQSDNPELRGKPVVIGAAPGHRGVVSACSYEARKFGIHSAMPISEAYRRCPQAVYLPVRMKRYHEVSVKIMHLFDDYTPDVRQISVDEATLNMTGTERLFGPPESAARLIKERVLLETGLTISVGVAPNRYLAKLASEYDKPDGLYVVERGRELNFLLGLKLSDLWGIGKKTLARLEELGISSVRELQAMTLEQLGRSMGPAGGTYLYRVARGEDPGIYSQARKSHSISNETTFAEDTDDRDEILRTLLALSHQVMFRMIDERVHPKTVFVKIRFADFRTTTAQRTVAEEPSSAEDIYSFAQEMLAERWTGGQLRLLGVGVSSSIESEEKGMHQGELFDRSSEGEAGDAPPARHPVSGEKRRLLENAVYKMKRRGNPLTKASLLPKKDKSDRE